MHIQSNTLLQGGKYKIEKVLGQGGFGITYLATQELLDRKVCIKEFFFKDYCIRTTDGRVTSSTDGNRDMVTRFLNKFLKEARTISSLDHPNIIRILDFFEENDTAYYVMEYIDGYSLEDKVNRQGALSENEAIEYIKQVGNALDYIHQNYINHLDVKPANIMVRRSDNKAILIDFGVSKHYSNEGAQTTTTPVGISHGYAPLEQYKRGGVGVFSPSTDIYSLGATLYKLVTGSTPPDANDILTDGFPSCSELMSNLVYDAIAQAMQPNKNVRPQSITEFFKILDVSFTNEQEETQCLDVLKDSFGIGNIYLGRVKKIIPSLNVCFVDVGFVQQAFLLYRELNNFCSYEHVGGVLCRENGQVIPCSKFENGNGQIIPCSRFEKGNGHISESLHEGEDILVQVIKPPISLKGPRLTTEISFVGHSLIFLPFCNELIVSPSIVSPNERDRLKHLVQEIKPGEAGVIVRTAAEGLQLDELRKELEKLIKQWNEIILKWRTAKSPQLLREGDGVVLDNEIFDWDCDSAEKGNDEGQYQLGYDYFYGQGVTQDYTLARYWLNKAAKQGNTAAKELLDECNERYGTNDSVERQTALVSEETKVARESNPIQVEKKKKSLIDRIGTIGLILFFGSLFVYGPIILLFDDNGSIPPEDPRAVFMFYAAGLGVCLILLWILRKFVKQN